jgi:hypothetical protein
MIRTTISKAVGWIERHSAKDVNALSTAFAGPFDTADQQDGMAASAQKRRPSFSQR